MWSGRSSFTSLVVGVFVVYVVHTCWVMYGIVYTRPCSGDSNCIQPYLARRPKLQVRVGGPKRTPPGRCYPIPYWHSSETGRERSPCRYPPPLMSPSSVLVRWQ